MAKTVGLILAICFLSLAHAHAHDVFNVEGDVYCDPCRVQFVTELSKKLPGATVRVECTDLVTKAVTYSAEGITGPDGHYSLEVTGDHENDNCEVSVVKSPSGDCSEPMGELEKSRIECTTNSGIHAAVRYANPIGFMTKAADPHCAPVLFNMGVDFN
ncbi:anther-specific protein LAT52-like [Salvia miltiorrhiza]|uniref:anther-specific protein LAT52-like n=1 Tax=Salvia miltiorrhiza TaxID=226208 RepID=UPI0025AC4F0B|nr:anther-specific protein LAT52-like [Salvia miltiorrhiza]